MYNNAYTCMHACINYRYKSVLFLALLCWLEVSDHRGRNTNKFASLATQRHAELPDSFEHVDVDLGVCCQAGLGELHHELVVKANAYLYVKYTYGACDL